MIRFVSITLLLISFTLGQSRMATVSGNVYLSDQTADHSGVKVIFEAVSTSATSDSTTSNSSGSYTIGLNDGIYLVHLSKNPSLTWNISQLNLHLLYDNAIFHLLVN